MDPAGRYAYFATSYPAGVVKLAVGPRSPADACPDGASPDQTVDFGGPLGNSGVPNYDRGAGCTILDLIDADASTRGALVGSVTGVAHELYLGGILTARERAQLIRTAAASIRSGPPAGTTSGAGGALAEALVRPVDERAIRYAAGRPGMQPDRLPRSPGIADLVRESAVGAATAVDHACGRRACVTDPLDK